jgi:uncharacterized protein YjbI with pentapeptide repeats
MKSPLIPTAAILTLATLAPAVSAENLDHLNQLLSTKQCAQCDLSGAGLVQANLAGANLSGANLSQANLSQANLSGADLRGANLSGASLNGANLIGANLSGAALNGTDLRGSYLTNANLLGTQLDNAYVQGALGMPNNAGTPELFYSWGLLETRKGNYLAALENYDKALNLNPEFAPAYLGRGLAQYRLGKDAVAVQDAQIASQLFEAQKNTNGYQASQNFIKGIEAARKANEPQRSSGFDQIVQTVGSLLLQYFLGF